MKLWDGSGSTEFTLYDSGEVEIFSVDSDGNTSVRGGLRLDSGGAECTTSEMLIVDGTIGISTTTVPEFKLSLDSDGGILAKGSYGSGATLSTAGAGTRLIWYPRKAAFRAGKVSGNVWDDANVGAYSAAFDTDDCG